MEIKRLEANVNQYSNTAVRAAIPLKFIYLNKVYLPLHLKHIY